MNHLLAHRLLNAAAMRAFARGDSALAIAYLAMARRYFVAASI